MDYFFIVLKNHLKRMLKFFFLNKHDYKETIKNFFCHLLYFFVIEYNFPNN